MVMTELIRIDREHLSECDSWYEYNHPTLEDETLIVELSLCTNPGGNNSLPHLWHKHGWTKEELESYWCVQTYAKDSEGNTYLKYNPTLKIAKYKEYDQRKRKWVTKRRREINFKWMLEGTEENRIKLLSMIEKEAFGMIATNEVKKSEIEGDNG